MRWKVKFVASRSHVAPVKQQSISYLELLGAVIESPTTFYLYFLCRFSVFIGWTHWQFTLDKNNISDQNYI